MAKILLTGGTGFFGKALLRHFCTTRRSSGVNADTDLQLVVLTRSIDNFLTKHPEFANLSWLKFAKANILDPSSLPSNQTFTHILHAATESTNGPALSPLARYNQIVDGTKNMLNYALQCRAKRFLLTSSGGVYGVQPATHLQLDETYHAMPDPMQPQAAYSIAKRASEHLCALYQQAFDLEIVVARCFAFVGQDLPLDAHFAIGNFILDALHNDRIVVKGDGTPIRTYMDQRDLAHWLITMLLQGIPGHAYNVGSEEVFTLSQVAALVGASLAPHKQISVLGAPDPMTFRNRYVPNTKKAQRELGLALKYSLIESLRDFKLQTR